MSKQKVFDFFMQLTQIPRCSGEEKQVSDFLVQFAKERNLDVVQDDALNVIIYKPASPGYEDKAPVILQGHMDMVCVKLDDFEFDFANEPIPVVIEGDTIKTKGTTLGADNGIAVAMIMAILDDASAIHPPLEVLITTDEEVGLLGAGAVDGSLFRAKTLINLDSEEEGIFLTGCAGGVRNVIELPIEFVPASKSQAYEIRIHGLAGGHSGVEIDKNRANANCLMARLLASLNNFELATVSGGEKMNAIAKQSRAIIISDQDPQAEITKWRDIFRSEYAVSDPELDITLSPTELSDQVFSRDSLQQLVALLNLIPQGVQAMSQHVPGLVETSTNFGVLSVEADKLLVESAHRSSIETKKQQLVKHFDYLAGIFGAKAITQGDYPGWAYSPVSKIRDLFMQVYQEVTGEAAQTTALHAGVECGVLQDRIGQLDMISLGPNMADVHTPYEQLSIASSQRTYQLLLSVLERL